MAGGGHYSDKDLQGLTIGHDEEAIREGEQIILTLRDKDVLAEDEDILENVQLVDLERANRNVYNKSQQGKSRYNPYSNEDEVDDFGQVKSKSLLSKYDEEIDGQKQQGFRIGQSKAERQERLQQLQEKLRKEQGTVSLQVSKYQVASEYMTEAEMGVSFKKKQKKSGKKSKKFSSAKPVRQDHEESDPAFLRQKIKQEPSNDVANNDDDDDDDLVDPAEEELQAFINQTLQTRLKASVRAKSDDSPSKNSDSGSKRLKTTNGDAFELTKVKQEPSLSKNEKVSKSISNFEPDEEDEPQLLTVHINNDVLLEDDDTDLEMQRAIERARRLKQQQINDEQIIEQLVETVKSERPILADVEIEEHLQPEFLFEPKSNGEIVLNTTAEFCRNLGDAAATTSDREDEELLDYENDLLEEKRQQQQQQQLHIEHLVDEKNQWSEVNIKDEQQSKIADIIEGQPILEEEPNVSVGIAGALKLAMKKGYLDKDVKKANISANISSLQAKNYTIEEKFYDDDKYSRRERFSGPISEFRDKAGYRPEVKLEYVDDNGRMLNEKEAFRVLSHKFHGKGPGKNKIDKRMKKIEQESKLLSMNSTDTPLGTLKMLQEKQKELHSAHVILSANQNVLSKKTT